MRNSELTKELILKEAGILFNTQGYKATSLSQITDATGLTKGAIYKHFINKENLEKETLVYLSSIVINKLTDVIKTKQTAPDKLRAIFYFFATYISKPIVQGGCPIINASIETDDSFSHIRKKASTLLDLLNNAIIKILENGIKFKQIKHDINTAYYATCFLAALEGAIMMSKLRKNDQDIKYVIKHLEAQVNAIEI